MYGSMGGISMLRDRQCSPHSLCANMQFLEEEQEFIPAVEHIAAGL